MKVLVRRQDLTRALALVNKIPGTNKVVRLRTNKNSLIVEASNSNNEGLYMTLSIASASYTIKDGKVCINASDFSDLLKFLRSIRPEYKHIELERRTDEKSLAVKVGGLTYLLKLRHPRH